LPGRNVLQWKGIINLYFCQRWCLPGKQYNWNIWPLVLWLLWSTLFVHNRYTWIEVLIMDLCCTLCCQIQSGVFSLC
jgi:hypothetical protein